MDNYIGVSKRFVAAMLVGAAIVWLSVFGTHTPAANRNSLAGALRNIQTDKATAFNASFLPTGVHFVELVGQSTVSTADLKSVASTF